MTYYSDFLDAWDALSAPQPPSLEDQCNALIEFAEGLRRCEPPDEIVSDEQIEESWRKWSELN